MIIVSIIVRPADHNRIHSGMAHTDKSSMPEKRLLVHPSWSKAGSTRQSIGRAGSTASASK
jgi:hypothetical protein